MYPLANAKDIVKKKDFLKIYNYFLNKSEKPGFSMLM